MDGYMALSQMPRNNLVSTDSILKSSSIWTEAIVGKSQLTEEQVMQFEKKKKDYINSMKASKSDEDGEDKDTRSACGKCGQRGHMAFQCFNFLDKTGKVDTRLNEMVASSDDDAKKGEQSNGRHHSDSSSHSHHRHHREKRDRSRSRESSHSNRHRHRHHHKK